MLETFIIEGAICLVAVILGSLIALAIQHRTLVRLHIQQQAWEHAQEGHWHQWEQQQEKQLSALSTQLTMQVEQIHYEWERWVEDDGAREKTLIHRYKEVEVQSHVERELAKLPRVEDAPITLGTNGQHHPPADWRPPKLDEAKLIAYDLSHRYMGQAELRNAQLQGSNFFMTDLSGACLAGANLSGADLSGANLSGADLRGAIMTGVNLQVADLHKAILINANLHGARNLTTEQIYSAVYDASTQLDAHIDVTMPSLPRIERIPNTPSIPNTPPQPTSPLDAGQNNAVDEDIVHLSAAPS